MSTNLPYFKFFTSEWLNGDIVLENYEIQGIFVNLCSFYWHKECKLSKKIAIKKLRIDEKHIDILVENGIIEITDLNYIVIRFLDEQFEDFITGKKRLSDAGKKGALIKALIKTEATFKPPLTIVEATIKEKIKKEDITAIDKIDFNGLLMYFNELFSKSCSVVPEKAKKSYYSRLKEGFTKENILNAMNCVKKDNWHKENDYKYATIMYFSQSKTLDTYGNIKIKNNEKYIPR